MTPSQERVHLLDVNVLVALFDAQHIHHEDAHSWFADSSADGWATCPLTENGFVRVVSNPAYPGRRTTVADAVERLRTLCASEHHVFWADELSLLDPLRIEPSHLGGHREVTDTYLLALSVVRDGTLATFDRSVRIEPVVGADSQHLALIPTEG